MILMASIDSAYPANMAMSMWFTISTLVLSVAVISMNTFFVSSVILLWSPLIMGGSDMTVRLAS